MLVLFLEMEYLLQFVEIRCWLPNRKVFVSLFIPLQSMVEYVLSFSAL